MASSVNFKKVVNPMPDGTVDPTTGVPAQKGGSYLVSIQVAGGAGTLVPAALLGISNLYGVFPAFNNPAATAAAVLGAGGSVTPGNTNGEYVYLLVGEESTIVANIGTLNG